MNEPDIHQHNQVVKVSNGAASCDSNVVPWDECSIIFVAFLPECINLT